MVINAIHNDGYAHWHAGICGFPFPTFFATRMKEKRVPLCFAPSVPGLLSASAGLGIRRQLD